MVVSDVARREWDLGEFNKGISNLKNGGFVLLAGLPGYRMVEFAVQSALKLKKEKTAKPFLLFFEHRIAEKMDFLIERGIVPKEDSDILTSGSLEECPSKFNIALLKDKIVEKKNIGYNVFFIDNLSLFSVGRLEYKNMVRELKELSSTLKISIVICFNLNRVSEPEQIVEQLDNCLDRNLFGFIQVFGLKLNKNLFFFFII